MTVRVPSAVIFGLLAIAPIALGAQDKDPLSAAKDLYASAAYEDALSALSRLDGESIGTGDLSRQVEEYRAFCLYALGRTGEAESVAESLIRKEPLVRLDAADASPRLETMFATVRKRLLPSLIRERFRAARAVMDEKNFSTAEPQLTEARLMIAEAQKLGVRDEGLADLGILVDGFLQLIHTSAQQASASSPAAPAPSPTGAADVSAPRAIAPAAARANTAAAGAGTRPKVDAPAASPAGTGGSLHIYTIDEIGVTPPVVVNQRMPSLTTEMVRIAKSVKSSMVLDIVIDETGTVVDTSVRKSLTTSFDDLIVRAARRWKYLPATKDGAPVRYAKTVVLVP